jgi:predicted metal-dependent hydrolase
MLHTYLDETIHYEVKYKNRTSFGITVDSYGNVEVQAPKGTAGHQIIQLLETNWNLILAKIEEMNLRLNGPQVKAYELGERFLYLGSDYPIQIFQEEQLEQDFVEFKGELLHIYVKQFEDARIKQALKRFYYQQSKALVEKSISTNQRNFHTKPRSIRITDNKTTWGTCDSRQQLTFNWRLAMAPLDVIEYVVVHEMCHMVHLNHDRSFWRLVGKIMPDYKEKEKWLAASSWKMTV